MTDELQHLAAALGDRYAVRRELGRGGMATVYLAEDLKLGRHVAVKVLKTELAVVLGAERFLREVTITAKLEHPHILGLYDSGEADGLLYYVMPYVEGESLRDRLDREKQLPVDDALQIAREVSDALSYAHSHGVVHRDIKPENILLKAGHAVVADFGIARAITAAGGDRLTETGVVLGTPTYMSPEQAAGAQDLDGRSDLYSLGCVLHEMLAGQPPFTGPTMESVLRQHLTVEPSAITALRPAVPAAVSAILSRALAKTPADRFSPVAQFTEALRAAMTPATEGVSPARGAPARRSWSPKTIVPLALAAVILVVGAVLIGRRLGGTAGAPELANGRVVVLPYANRTGDPTLDPVGQMTAEWITEGLMQTGAVQVVPNVMVVEAVSQARDTAGAIVLSRVAQMTSSGIAVMGSYYRSGEDLEFHTEVVDVSSGTPFATIDPIVGSADDPRSAIDSVRIQVMGALATRLSPLMGWELPPGTRPPTYEASRAYARGMEEWVRSDYRAAARSFLQAYVLDTTYLRSLMLATSAYGNEGERGRSDSLFQVLLARRDELAPYDRYRIDWAVASRRGDRAAALAAARAGVDLVPFGTLRWALIGALIGANRPHEALRTIEEIQAQFVQLGGAWSAHWEDYTTTLHLLRRHERELDVAREARAYVSDPTYALAFEGRALAALGRLDELTPVVDGILLAAPQSPLLPGAWLEEIAEELRAHDHAAEALDVANRALEWLDQQSDTVRASVGARSLRGQLSYLSEDWTAAAAVFSALAADSADLVDALGYQGTIAARQGDSASARRFATELAEPRGPRQDRAALRWRARIAALLGQRDEAVALLQSALREGLGYGLWLHRDMDLESLRRFPPFEELVAPKG